MVRGLMGLRVGIIIGHARRGWGWGGVGIYAYGYVGRVRATEKASLVIVFISGAHSKYC